MMRTAWERATGGGPTGSSRERRQHAAMLLGGALLLVASVGGISIVLPTTVPLESATIEGPPQYAVVDYVRDLDAPMSVSWLPDGRVLVSEATGAIRVVEQGKVRDTPWAVVPNPRVDVSAGLMGMAVDPDFPAMPYVYVYYQQAETAGEGPRNVLLRLREEGGSGVVDRTLLDFDFQSTEQAQRVGGVVHFGPDGALYVTTGDPEMLELGDRSGKLLRITRDGAPAPGNPPIGTGISDPRVFAAGLRDPGDFDWNVSGELVIGDRDDAGRGQVRVVTPGVQTASVDSNGAARPLHPTPYRLEAGALAGLESVRSDTLPANERDIFVCTIEDGSVRRLFVDTNRDAGEQLSQEVIAHSCTADLTTGADGHLYIVDTAGGRVRVLKQQPEDSR